MHVPSFLCPHCTTPLKVKNRLYVDRQVNCPECREPIRIVSGDHDRLIAEPIIVSGKRGRADATEAGRRTRLFPRNRSARSNIAIDRPTSPSGKSAQSALRRRLAGYFRALATPLGIAWLVAGAATVLLVLALNPIGGRGRGITETDSPVESDVAIRDASAKKSVAPQNQRDPRLPGVLVRHRGVPGPPPIPQPVPMAVDERKTGPHVPIAARKPPSGETSRPGDVAIAEVDVPKPIDVAAALSQKISKFELRRAVPLLLVLSELEEMAGVEIRYDKKQEDAFSKALDTPISLTLSGTTVGKILTAVLERAGLEYEIESTGIRLILKKTAPTNAK